MRENRPDTPRRRATRLYAVLLRLYPRAHRQAFGKQMLQAFADHYHDAVETNGESEARYWLRVVGDEGTSLLREHIAALAERIPSMKKLLPAIWEPVTIVAALALFWMLLDLAHLSNLTPLSGLPLYLVMYFPLLFLVLRLLRGMPRPEGADAVSWWRLGLLLGGLTGLYMVALNLLDALAPVRVAPQNLYGNNVGPVWLLTLPLLAGVVGIVGGYVSGRLRTGAAAGLLAGGVMLGIQIASTVLLVVVLWPALRANALHSQLQIGTQAWIQQQWSVQHPGATPRLWTYLTNPQDDEGIAFGVLFKSVFTIIAWLAPVLVGSGIGAYAAHRIHTPRRSGADATGQATWAPSDSAPLRLTVLLLGVGILIWSGFTVISSRLMHDNLQSATAYLRDSFTTPGFFAWLLAFLVMAAALFVTMFVTVRPERATPHVGEAGA